MNNAITEIKSTLEHTNSKVTEAEERISEVEDRMVWINETERKKRKQRIKRNEDNLRDLWDNVKDPNIQSIGVLEEENIKKRHEKILEEIIVENFPKLGKEIPTQVQETQRILISISCLSIFSKTPVDKTSVIGYSFHSSIS